MTQRNVALVRGGYIANRSKEGYRSYKPLKGFFNYITYGRYRDSTRQQAKQPRGPWLNHNDKDQSHQDVLQWAKRKVHQFGYDHAYQILLSTWHGHLLQSDFTQTLAHGTALSGVYE